AAEDTASIRRAQQEDGKHDGRPKLERRSDCGEYAAERRSSHQCEYRAPSEDRWHEVESEVRRRTDERNEPQPERDRFAPPPPAGSPEGPREHAGRGEHGEREQDS